LLLVISAFNVALAQQMKIAYVNSDRVLAEFDEAKEAQSIGYRSQKIGK